MVVRELTPAVQQYAWGKPASSSKVAQLAGVGTQAEPEATFAELWMGTHPNGPATIKATGELLSDVIGGQLPYLFKVLSVGKALSIQAHPDKTLAARLHADRPHVYKDANHKPEMCIALTDYEAMCGFRDTTEIARHLQLYPEFTALVGSSASESFLSSICSSSESSVDPREALRALFRCCVTAESAVVAVQVAALVQRLSSSKHQDRSDLDSLLLRLNDEFPGDIGVFAPLYLNVLRVQPGQSFFMNANEPHAYLSGDCLEAMACSDNVVRAGLTPKLRDTEVLCEMLTYRSPGKPDVGSGTALDQFTQVYRPPVSEFAVSVSSLPSGGSTTLPSVGGWSILLVLNGSGQLDGETPVQRGQVFLVEANSPVRVSGALQVARCFENRTHSAL